ncbi:NAD(P)-dependent oxidoreductase [Actinoplanes sp. NPDC026619]|uniref:NAD-dependent epimerase/dehydratase family protein n=1 Tax=Actinoplanes sp. NPDC026619 TaxID=3155798 RepID=UPI0033EDC7EB
MTGRVLVTGATGIIGREVVRHLLDSGSAVTALSADRRTGLPPEVRTVVGDATAERLVDDALTGCDAVVHLAALAHPSLGTPLRVYANNVVSTFTVLSLAAERGIGRAVIASSINATGVNLNPHQVRPAYFPLDEDSPADIADAYSLSKRVDELAAAMVARTWGTTVVALRFPLVKTPAELRAVAAGEPAEMMRTGWAYLTVNDAARAVLAALRAPLIGSHVIGLSAATTLLDRPTTELLDTYAPEVPRRRAFTGREALVDASAARRLLGFEPRETI